ADASSADRVGAEQREPAERRQVGRRGDVGEGRQCWSVTSVMSRLDQYVSEVSVACTGDLSAAPGRSAGMLTRGESGVAHELACGGEASEVTHLGNDGGRGMEGQATQALDGRHEGQEGTLLGALLQRGVQTSPAVFSCS